jgi:hypothetical protein
MNIDQYDERYLEQLVRVANLIADEDLPLFRDPQRPGDGPDPRTLKRVVEELKVTDAEAVLLIARFIDYTISHGRDVGLLPHPNQDN